jgi:hypothetical protein
MIMPLGVLSCLGFALDGLRSILVTAFAYAITAGLCVLMISWPRLCSITLAYHSLCVFLSPSPFYFLFSIVAFFFCRLDFSLVNGLIARTLRLLDAYCLTRGATYVLCMFFFGKPVRCTM